MVVRPGSLTTYKDRKHFQKEPHKTFKATLDLRGFEADVPADYNTKKHNNVFRLRHASTGSEYLFETTNEVSFLVLVSLHSKVYSRKCMKFEILILDCRLNPLKFDI